MNGSFARDFVRKNGPAASPRRSNPRKLECRLASVIIPFAFRISSSAGRRRGSVFAIFFFSFFIDRYVKIQ